MILVMLEYIPPAYFNIPGYHVTLAHISERLAAVSKNSFLAVLWPSLIMSCIGISSLGSLIWDFTADTPSIESSGLNSTSTKDLAWYKSQARALFTNHVGLIVQGAMLFFPNILLLFIHLYCPPHWINTRLYIIRAFGYILIGYLFSNYFDKKPGVTFLYSILPLVISMFICPPTLDLSPILFLFPVLRHEKDYLITRIKICLYAIEEWMFLVAIAFYQVIALECSKWVILLIFLGYYSLCHYYRILIFRASEKEKTISKISRSSKRGPLAILISSLVKILEFLLWEIRPAFYLWISIVFSCGASLLALSTASNLEISSKPCIGWPTFKYVPSFPLGNILSYLFIFVMYIIPLSI
jgi:hypothetical protein